MFDGRKALSARPSCRVSSQVCVRVSGCDVPLKGWDGKGSGQLLDVISSSGSRGRRTCGLFKVTLLKSHANASAL